jgi:nicotinamide phosphoribosyltransferase
MVEAIFLFFWRILLGRISISRLIARKICAIINNEKEKYMGQDLVINNLDLVDSYKDTQFSMYPTGVETIYDYFEPRGGIYPYTCLFGLQYILKRYLAGEFVTQNMLNEQIAMVMPNHMGPQFKYNVAGWQYLIDEYGGRLPVKIRAVQEGIPIPVKNIVLDIENTGGNKTAWIPNFLETIIQQSWYGSSVFSTSRIIKETIHNALVKSSESINGEYPSLPFQLHDFGFRGVSSVESSAIGGAAHLCNFLGTDNKIAMSFLHQYYNAPYGCGKSVVASEHSVMEFSLGEENEAETVSRILDENPIGIVSIVGDTYNIFKFADNIIGKELHDKIMNRPDGSKVVIRPDSGEPTEIVLYVLNSLANSFGYTVNSLGYKVLNPHVGVIQGDGMTPSSIKELFDVILTQGWSAENVLTGSGGGLLQRINRDSQKFAIKASAAIVDGKVLELFKDPITDPGKKSKRGFHSLVFRNGSYQTINRGHDEIVPDDLLEPVFENGEILRDLSWDTICKNAAL